MRARHGTWLLSLARREASRRCARKSPRETEYGRSEAYRSECNSSSRIYLVAIVLSQQYENVTLEQSKNVPLTGSGWTGAGRTAIDEPSREGPVGDIAQGEEAGHHASGSSGRVGRERAACEAAVEGAEETRLQGRDPWPAREVV